MNKRYLHYIWTRIRPVRTGYLFLAFLVATGGAALALRNNYTTMTRLRNDVYQADKNNGDVEKALQRLRAYVGGHMDTNLATADGVYPPIQLKYTYERLRQAEQERVNTTNSQVYTEAQRHCESLFPGSFSGGPRVPCIEQYVKDHGTTARTIPDAMYKFSFASPRWSLDFAGWLVAFSALLAAATVLRFFVGRWLQHVTR